MSVLLMVCFSEHFKPSVWELAGIISSTLFLSHSLSSLFRVYMLFAVVPQFSETGHLINFLLSILHTE